jgi:hypothetical protein
MERREFLGALSVAGIAAAAGRAQDQAAKQAREFYELRRYRLRNGGPSQLTTSYLRTALVPALSRAGMEPVGVFNVLFGEGPTAHVLIPHKSIESVVTLGTRLADDAEYMKSAAAFLDAPRLAPAFERLEVSLLMAFEKQPRLEAPGVGKARIFELRRYESPTVTAGKKKVDMFNNGEIALFKRLGFRPVFFAETIAGPRMPCLEYMTTFETQADRDEKWKTFSADAEWKKMSALPEYADVVSQTMISVVTPAAFSQI